MATKPPLKLQKTLLSERPRKGSLTAALYGLCALLAVFTLDQQSMLNMPEAFTATRAQVFGHHEYWRAFTTLLVHADLGHLLANSVFFTGLAFLLNGYFGAWAFPALSFLAGGLTNLIVLAAYPEGVTLVGASGVVYFMAAFWLTLYFFVQRGLTPWRRAINALSFALVLLFPELIEERVSYLSHAVGFALGLPFGAAFFRLKKSSIRSHEVWSEPEQSGLDLEEVMQETRACNKGPEYDFDHAPDSACQSVC
jgi:rhomboid protease GluP